MTRNIDILREIGKEIEAFRYAEDDLGVELDVEGTELVRLCEREDPVLLKIREHIFAINAKLDRLTEDFRDVMDCEGFDCDSFRWCCGKIRYDGFEIANYMKSFTEMLSALGLVISEYLRLYKLMTQGAYDGGGEPEDERTVGEC